MPLSGDFRGLKKLERAVESLGTGASRDQMLYAVRTEVNTLLRDEFKTSSGPDGESWQETVRGKPAMVSRKLPFAFASRADRGELRFMGKTKRDLLTALHGGHIFKARSVAAASGASSEGVLRFNAKGKLVKASRFAKLKRGRAVLSKAHTVGQRVLPPRPIIPPDGAMPLRWQSAINAGVTKAIAAWADRAQR